MKANGMDTSFSEAFALSDDDDTDLPALILGDKFSITDIGFVVRQ